MNFNIFFEQTKSASHLLRFHKTFIMKFSLPFVSLLLISHCAYAEGSLLNLADRLDANECYTARATYEVLLPNTDSPVSYSIDLMSYPAKADTLSPCEYLIRWNPVLKEKTPAMDGFASYFNSNFFRFSGGKLLEYHFTDNPSPFAPRGYADGGVQQKEQFASLLPQMIADDLRKMASDSSYTFTVERKKSGTEIKGAQTIRGYLCSEFTYRFSDDGMPVFKEVTTNPDQMGEQVITVNYSPAASDNGCYTITEQTLIEHFPEIFEKYRRDSFALESLRGAPLPSFAIPTLSRDRYSHQRGEALGTPAVIAVLDNSVDGTAQVVAALRSAIDALPYSATLILAFTDKDTDIVNETTGPQRPGEVILLSARSLARDCGITDTPSIIFCRADGSVADIHVGRNNNLRDIVIQKATLAR